MVKLKIHKRKKVIKEEKKIQKMEEEKSSK
jgi:hypothetical protein